MSERGDEVKLSGLGEKELLALSKKMLLSLDANEMREVQAHYKKLKREPKQIELETIAQTWSEHCKHKTFRAEIEYNKAGKKSKIQGLFAEFIRKPTLASRKKW